MERVEAAGMGSAMGALVQTDVTPAPTSSGRRSFQTTCARMFKCRKTRASSSKKSKREPNWFNEDIWICIMSCLDAKTLLRLAVTSRQFYALVKDDVIWKSVFLRDIPTLSIDMRPAFSWMSLYLAACDGRHTFSYHDSEKHIDWMRIGVFCLDSGEAVATDRLKDMKQVSEATDTLQSDSILHQSYSISNVKKGYWIADLHLVHCPVCNLATCEGTMQALDVRHWELFLNNEYKTGEWRYEQVHTRHVAGHCDEAAACVFDANQLRSKGTQEVLDMSKWIAAPGNWVPRGITSSHGAASCTNLHLNKGVHSWHAIPMTINVLTKPVFHRRPLFIYSLF
ncbi:hypothetical protein M758_5G124700 [Ceratodon purpureus]|nr:hypothetical protein M758_5G124700 [Ceratodon purpureus]